MHRALRDPEVRQPRHAVTADDEVLFGYVAVQDVERLAARALRLVRGVEPVQRVEDDAKENGRWHALVVERRQIDEPAQGLALDIVEHEVDASLVLSRLVQPDDVGVVQHRDDARLVEKARHDLVGRHEMLANPLDGHEALDPRDAARHRELDRAHPARRQLGVALVFSMGCELVLGDIPENSSSSSATGADVGSAGGSSSTSAGGSTGTTGTGGCCDCDGDGHSSMACPGGDDCDDNNKDVFPGQVMYFPVPTHPGGGFDYDCNGKAEFKSPAVVDCSLLGALCDAMTHGYLGKTHPACGETGRVGTCSMPNAVTCQEQVEQPSVTVLCR